jgi:short-subunit dehydrogenase
MAPNFKDKTVIITGASAGVGAACARAFAAHGANLVLVARGAQGLDRIAAELSPICQVYTYAMDVANQAHCVALMQRAHEHFGGVDILVNNAGMHSRGDLEKVAIDDLGAMVDVNLRAPIVLSRAAIPYLRKSNAAAIVMVGSLAGRAPLQGAATYSATKAGLRAFTYAIADELKPHGINVGVVSPGPIDTGFIMDEIDNVEDIVFSQPMSSADQVAAAIMAIAVGSKNEISMPKVSGWLTTISYLFPSLRRKLRPKLYKIGRKNKDKYRRRDS